MAVSLDELASSKAFPTFRAGGDVPVTSQQLYTGGDSSDLRQTLIYLSHRYPDAPLLGVGFSVGSNILAKYIGEEEDNSRLSAGCLLGCVSTQSISSLEAISSLTGSSHGIS